MSEYTNNTYELVAEIRRAIKDYSTGKVQGTDTSGPFSNEIIVKYINDAQKFLFDILFARQRHLFLTSASITGSSSEYTLPANFFKLRLFETSAHVQIHPIPVTQRHLNDDGGSKYLYYRTGKILRVDKDSLADVNTLWYYTRPREITMGKVQTGGALSMTLATTARKEVDYYNGMYIEDITGDWSAEISDYSTARVATVAATAGTADYYGIVSELPEEFHRLIGRRAGLYMKTLPDSPVQVSPAELKLFEQDLIETVRSFCGDADDETMEEQILNLEPFIP
jgi:hypothetical protein